MATIKRIEGKRGVSYQITVTKGRDSSGKQLRHYKTWTPPAGMKEAKIEEAVKRAAYDFERELDLGFIADDRQTFAQYAEYVIGLKERSGTKKRTLELYRDQLKRINAGIGHMKLKEIRPQHLNRLYENLCEEGIRSASVKATPKRDISLILKERKLSLAAVGRSCGMAPTTFSPAVHGKTVSKETAEKLATTLGFKPDALFTFSKDARPLSPQTVLRYHRLISVIFSQAEKEMLILYNPAHRATPPKKERKEAESFQPEELARILDCLEREPVKWRALVQLLIVTGCRRGEIAGLRWDAVDFDRNQLRIERALLYTPKLGIYEDTTKTGETRYIKIPNETKELLKLYQAHHDGQKLKYGDQWKDSGYVFTSEDGGPMNPGNITQWCSDFSKRYGLPPIHPHKFRHTMASLLIYHGTDVLTVSKRLGHAQVSTTTDIYSHAIKEADERAAESIADVILRRA